MKIYLAGPVGYGNPGREWKEEIIEVLRKRGHEVYDPIENDGKYPRVAEMNMYKKESKKYHHQINNIMQQIFYDDCEYITNCDWIICYFIGRSYGTVSEQGISYYIKKFLNKPIKIISIFDESINPDEWLLCCSDYSFFSHKDGLEFIKEHIK